MPVRWWDDWARRNLSFRPGPGVGGGSPPGADLCGFHEESAQLDLAPMLRAACVDEAKLAIRCDIGGRYWVRTSHAGLVATLSFEREIGS